MRLHRLTGDPESRGRARDLELTAALAKDVLEQGVETVDVAEAEVLLNVAGEERVEPLPVERRALRSREEGLRKAAVEEALLERRAEGVQLAPSHGQKVDAPLAPRERVAKLPARREGRGAGREDADLREEIGPDLQDAGRVLQLVDLVEDDDGTPRRAEEEGGVVHHLLGDGQVAVDVEGPIVAEAPGERRLSAAPDAAQPDDRRLLPASLDPGEPVRAVYHGTVLYVWTGQT